MAAVSPSTTCDGAALPSREYTRILGKAMAKQLAYGDALLR